MRTQATQTSISFSTRGLNVRRTLIPGAFRVRGMFLNFDKPVCYLDKDGNKSCYIRGAFYSWRLRFSNSGFFDWRTISKDF